MNKSLQYISGGALSVGSLASYIHWVNQIPLLSEQEELALTEKLRQYNDLASARKLILAHLRFVVRIARGYDGYGLPQADLIQEGNIGLMKAVKRFDPSVGVRLVSFAVHWIRAEIHEFVLRNWRIVKIATTKKQRKLFFNLRKAAKKRGWFSNDEVAVIAAELNVSHKDVRQMEARLNTHDQAFDTQEVDDDAGNNHWNPSPVNYLEDQSSNPARMLEGDDWDSNCQQRLYDALDKLDERSREILKQRWLTDKKSTLHELAALYEVSAERIRQLERTAMQKLRQQLNEGAYTLQLVN